ncbi:MAG: hypothetical protein UT19_C0001G0008 [Candidatus Woesebacteria bacterium GW2011_GWB1_39_10b]|uniref:Uncharacterized protein n=2 Tax=Candidatus Woeseibacteriota TaxID=1752722 RepID=A0A0G0QPA2_9BACT|nr:MAG: hypothetical protein US72_C0003G0051 [Microgenomates group bacterium GW2011_GWC1_38_12]KKQ94476.1 MAG: hypothetical protein UT19_C0001G0008 [Candidatus Woesebacteria bacterium GW2011_GWB1_39_10b]KKR12225.1 MAG: hypothetical protein UT40_C0028G0012 [Candidatus Woesebacteria bacterium GW2011_GWA1_39_21b]
MFKDRAETPQQSQAEVTSALGKYAEKYFEETGSPLYISEGALSFGEIFGAVNNKELDYLIAAGLIETP